MQAPDPALMRPLHHRGYRAPFTVIPWCRSSTFMRTTSHAGSPSAISVRGREAHGHHSDVRSVPELVAAVEAAFVETGRRLATWPDPHPDRSPYDDEYSRVTDPGKWRIVGARADAWLAALAETALAEVEFDTEIVWRVPPSTIVTRTHRAMPRVAGAMPLVVARSRLDAVDDAGVTLGVGHPAVRLAAIPTCGCDACDSGSQDVLDELDEYVLGVVSGAYRRLWKGDREITVISQQRWSASGVFDRGEVEVILSRPDGWHELPGASWMAAD